MKYKLDMKKIGLRIKEERENSEKYKNQQDFLEAMNKSRDSRQTVWRWEKGETLPPIEDMLKMCDLFDCEIDYLLGVQDNKTKIDTDISKEIGIGRTATKKIQVKNWTGSSPNTKGKVVICKNGESSSENTASDNLINKKEKAAHLTTKTRFGHSFLLPPVNLILNDFINHMYYYEFLIGIFFMRSVTYDTLLNKEAVDLERILNGRHGLWEHYRQGTLKIVDTIICELAPKPETNTTDSKYYDKEQLTYLINYIKLITKSKEGEDNGDD